MSHPEQRKFVELVSAGLPMFFNGVSVLEIGSLDINGSVRQFFEACDYTGIDVAEGKGVDVVCQGQEYAAPASSFDQVISCEAMEHNPHWRSTFSNMVRMCKPGGLVTMTCATLGRPEHGTARTSREKSPLTVNLGWNYYHNLGQSDFCKSVNMDSAFSHHFFAVNWSSYDLYFCGIRSGSHSDLSAAWADLTRGVSEYVAIQNKRKVCTYRRLAARCLGDWWFESMRKLSQKFKWKTLAYMHQ